MIFFRAIFLSAFFYLFAFVAAAQHTNDLEPWNLKGKVQSVTAQEWVMRDSLGHTQRKKKMMGFGLMDHQTFFNASGHIVSSTELDSTKGKKALYYTYNSDNSINTVTRLNRDKTVIVTRYEYETGYNLRTTYAVNEKNERWKTEEETLDTKGRTIESKNYTPGDTLSSSARFVYNDKGQLVAMTEIYRSGTRFEWSWKWKNGVKAQGIKVHYVDDKSTGATTYFYDQANHITREIEAKYATHTNIATLNEYTFDEKGNWLTRKKYTPDAGKTKLSLYFYAERQITYFE